MYKIHVSIALHYLNLILTMLDFWTITPTNTGESEKSTMFLRLFSILCISWNPIKTPINKIGPRPIKKIKLIKMHYLGLSSKAKNDPTSASFSLHEHLHK